MPEPWQPTCRDIRTTLAAGRGVSGASLPHPRESHLAGCPACRAAAAAVEDIAAQAPRAPLYTPELRRRTLLAARRSALASAGRGSDRQLLALLPLAAGCGLLWTGAPICALGPLLGLVMPSTTVAWLVASGIVLTTSAGAGGVLALVVKRLFPLSGMHAGASGPREV